MYVNPGIRSSQNHETRFDTHKMLEEHAQDQDFDDPPHCH